MRKFLFKPFKSVWCHSLFFLFLLTGIKAGLGQGAQTIQSPANGNPIIPGYFADPEIFLINGTFYAYGTTDGYDVGGIESGPFVCWSSTDLVNWSSTTFDYPASFPLNSTKNWAPSLAKGPDGRYYLYYISAGYNCFVASSATPLGPWQGENGNNMIHADMFDTSAFQDTDGSTWLIYMGQPMVNNDRTIYAGKLAANMTSFVSEPVPIYHSGNVFEGPTMFKRGNLYYLCYSAGGLGGSYNTQVVYGNSITGTYTVNNPLQILVPTSSLNYSATGGGRVFQVGNRFLMAYHRMSYPYQGAAWRQTLLDEVTFNADGININQITETYDGVGAIAPLTTTLPNLAYLAATTASSSQSTDYVAAYATDQNLGSEWKAGANSYPQWLQVDLGASRVIGSVVTAFEHYAEYYQYTIQYSTNGTTWSTYADRSTNTIHNSPMVDTKTVTARYLKLNITYSSKTNQSPGVWDFKVYPPSSTVAAPTGVTAVAGPNPPTVQWTASPGASAYSVQRGLFSVGPYVAVGNAISGTTFTDTTASSGKTYYYVVSAIDSAGGAGPISSPASATTNFLAYLKFDETSGTTAADSSGNNPATLVNGPTWGPGYLKNAVNLSGASQYLTLPPGIVSNLNDFTITSWVKVGAFGTFSRIFDFGTGTTNYMFLTPQSTASGGNAAKMRFAIRTPSVGEQIIDSSTAIPVGTWVHVAVTLSGSTGRLYLNGTQVGSNSSMTLAPSSLGSTTLNYLGRSQFSADPYFIGGLDDFHVYSYALSDSTLANLANPAALPPDSIAATPDSGKVSLSWSGASAATSYNLRRGTTSGGPYAAVTNGSGITGTGFIDNGLTNGTTYYYVIASNNSLGQSANSTEVAVTPGNYSRLYLKFDETTGSTAADSSGQGFNATTVNNPTWVTGKIGNAINLTAGSSQYVNLPSAVATGLKDFTIMAWVNFTSVVANERIFDFGGSTAPGATAGTYMFLTPSGSNGIRYATTTAGYNNEQGISATTPLTTGQWMHVAVTLSGTTGRIYVNGVLLGTNTAMTLNPSSLGTLTQNYIGKSLFSADPYLNGAVDDFRVYSRAMNASEVSLFANPLTAPQNVAATSQPSAIALTWNSVPNANSYTVKYATASGGPYAILTSGLSSSSFTHGNLAYGATYYYTISASDVAGTSSDSTPVTASAASALISGTESTPPTLVLGSNGSLTLTTAATVAGHNYQLQTSTTLDPASWVNVGNAASGTGSALQFGVNYDSTEPRRFYRISISR